MSLAKKTKEVFVGGIGIGGDHPISIQSMCNTKTYDVESTVRQILVLEEAGCEIIRVTVPDEESARALSDIKKQIHIPLVADIHFDYRMALLAIENGADKIRINPGNILSNRKGLLAGENPLRLVVDAAKAKNIPIRVGVNAGSLEKDLADSMGICAESICESALRGVRTILDMGYDNLVVSLKASNLDTCIRAYELFSQKSDLPTHIGITETGTFQDGLIKSGMGLGILLREGIGNTMRVSLTADPVEEVYAAQKILQYAGIRCFGAEIISCPTCGRTNIDIVSLSEKAQKALQRFHTPMKVAVMGCIVNGPGEAKEADFGIAGGIGEALLFRKGEIIGKIPEEKIIETLIKEAEYYVARK